MTDTTQAAKDAQAKAAALHAQGRAAEAEQAYLAALRIDPELAGALHGLGVLLIQTGRAAAAVTLLRRATELGAGDSTARNNLGVALCAAGQMTEAAEVYRQILRDAPNQLQPLINLGKILNVLGAFGEARSVLERALALAPQHAAVREQLAYAAAREGEALGAAHRHEEAAAAFERAVTLVPGLADAHHNRGTALAYLGRSEEAAAAFSRAVALAPDNPAFLRAALGMATAAQGDPHVKALEAMEAAGRLSPEERVAVPFALAKAYEETGDFARSFAALARGNAARRAASRYDVSVDLNRLAAIARVFDADFIAANAGEGCASDVPVFIVGMPRSGTTLVEQIIASHPHVFGGGELAILPDMINAREAGEDFPNGVVALGAGAFRSLGEAYVRRLRTRAEAATRITDKLPLNFQLIGLIHLALPTSRIIHVRRDPVDTCFSCYSVLFEADLDFSCDLDDLARYYRSYGALMAHWRKVLPPGRMLEIDYETLVSDSEAEARRLIAHCGLAWDDRCLRAHETSRAVETASALQVRRPVYQSSVGRAGRFAPWLEPLRRGLEGGDPPAL